MRRTGGAGSTAQPGLVLGKKLRTPRESYKGVYIARRALYANLTHMLIYFPALVYLPETDKKGGKNARNN